MRRWQLSCPLLLEFYPRSPALAGLNVGGGAGGTSEIKIRLRRPGQEGEFFHYEHILGTMLHELVHNLRCADQCATGPYEPAIRDKRDLCRYQ